jgi:3-oxoacyl-[acyl-carrier protein] reductase
MSTVVVTGATGEAGRAASTVLLAAGHSVVAVGSDQGRLETVDATVRFVCDLADAASTLALAARVRDEVAQPDALIHLVGGWRGGHETEDWDWLEPRILTTLRNATLAFHDDLTASSDGRLVVVGSTSAAKPTWSGANYATLKTAANAWTQAIASGWRKAGTAAAVTLLVKSIGPDGTSAETLASEITKVLGQDASEINGTAIDLS